MSFPTCPKNHCSVLSPGGGQRRHRRPGSLRAATHRPNLEVLELRTLLSFSAPVDYAVGTNSHAVVAADFNNDGRLDLATANWDSNAGVGNVSVLLGNGNGTFQAARNYDNGSAPESIFAGDFNGDGKLDLVTGDMDNDYRLHRCAVGQREWHLPVGPGNLLRPKHHAGLWRWAISTPTANSTSPRQATAPTRSSTKSTYCRATGMGRSPSAVLTTNFPATPTFPSRRETSTATARWT